MHKHRGDSGRDKKNLAFADSDADWEWPRSKRGHAGSHRVRHRAHEKYSRMKRDEWLEEFDGDDY